MMRAAIDGITNNTPSEMLSPRGVMPETRMLPGCPKPARRIRKKGRARRRTIAVTRARKMSSRHPARIPSGPRKIVFGGGAGVGAGAAGVVISGSGMISSSDIARHLSRFNVYADFMERPAVLQTSCMDPLKVRAKHSTANNASLSGTSHGTWLVQPRLPVELHCELELTWVIRGRCLAGIAEQGADRGYVHLIRDVEHVGDQVHVETLTEINALGNTDVAEHCPGRDSRVAAEVAIELQQSWRSTGC